MRRIKLDASRWSSIDDFYDALLSALGSPESHGRESNELINYIIDRGMNAVNLPYTINIAGTTHLDNIVLEHLSGVEHFLAEREPSSGRNGIGTLTRQSKFIPATDRGMLTRCNSTNST